MTYKIGGSAVGSTRTKSDDKIATTECYYIDATENEWREASDIIITTTRKIMEEPNSSSGASDTETLRAEIETLRREIRMRQGDPFRLPYSPPIKLQEVLETVLSFDGHNISML